MPRFALLITTLSPAQAQEIVADGPELGWIGLGGMIACAIGIVFGVLNRRSLSLREKAATLETEIEFRDDRIWSLEEQLAHLTALVDGQGDLVVREDEHGRATHASKAACELLGKQLHEVIGRPVLFQSLHIGLRMETPDGGHGYDQEIATQSGARWISWKETVIRDSDNNVIEVQRTGRDITARVATERALEARAKKRKRQAVRNRAFSPSSATKCARR